MNRLDTHGQLGADMPARGWPSERVRAGTRLRAALGAFAGAVLVAAGMASPALASDARTALLIGLSRYADPAVVPLRGVEHDMTSARTIARAMGIPDSGTRVIRNAEATKAGLLAALRELGERTRDGSRAFIYFSGHGTRYFDPQAGGCVEGLLTYDGQVITNAELAEATQPVGRRADKMIVMLDACHSEGVLPAKAAATRGLSGTLVPKFSVPASGTSPAACSVVANYRTRGLLAETTRLGALRENVVMITSARPDEVSFDEPERGGLATQGIRDCLLGKARDLDASGAVSLEEIRACAQSIVNERLRPFPALAPHTITLSGNRNLVPVPVSRPPVAIVTSQAVAVAAGPANAAAAAPAVAALAAAPATPAAPSRPGPVAPAPITAPTAQPPRPAAPGRPTPTTPVATPAGSPPLGVPTAAPVAPATPAAPAVSATPAVPGTPAAPAAPPLASPASPAAAVPAVAPAKPAAAAVVPTPPAAAPVIATPAAPPVASLPPVTTPSRPAPAAPTPPASVSAPGPAPAVAVAAAVPAAPAPAPPTALAPEPSPPPPPLASLATLTDIASQADPRRLPEVSGHGRPLRIGRDSLDLTITPARDGYLYLVLLGSDARSFYLLFPNGLDSDNRVRGGQPLRLPREDWRIRAAGPVGVNQVLVVVSDTPRSLERLGRPRPDARAPFTFALNTLGGRSALFDFLTAAPAGGTESFGARLITVEEVK